MLDVLCAVGLAKAWQQRGRAPLYVLLMAGLWTASCMATCGFTAVSHFNYPGGTALQTLHTVAANHTAGLSPSVHIDNLACISGVSRFGELPDRFRYSKAEGLQESELAQFDYLIHERPSVPGFSLRGSVAGLSRVDLRSFPPRIVTEQQLFILAKDRGADPTPPG